MGYRAEKQKQEAKLKIVKRIALAVLLLVLVGLCVLSAVVPPNTWKYHVGKPEIQKRKAGEARIHFLSVGQGDCILIECPDGKVALIDGGTAGTETEKRVMRYLNALEIDVIDHLIITHADEDHCGALDVVLQHKTVLNAYLPPTSPVGNGEYAEAYAMILKENCTRVYSSRAIENLGDDTGAYPYTFTFLYPYRQDVEAALDGEAFAENELSAVLYFEYQGIGALLAGDIDTETEKRLMMDDRMGLFAERGVQLSDTEILKVAHHGSSSSTSRAWLEYLHTEQTIVSCGKDNLYGHPSDEVLQNITAVGAKLWRTDLQGHAAVTVSADGTYKIQGIK